MQTRKARLQQRWHRRQQAALARRQRLVQHAVQRSQRAQGRGLVGQCLPDLGTQGRDADLHQPLVRLVAAPVGQKVAAMVRGHACRRHGQPATRRADRRVGGRVGGRVGRRSARQHRVGGDRLRKRRPYPVQGVGCRRAGDRWIWLGRRRCVRRHRWCWRAGMKRCRQRDGSGPVQPQTQPFGKRLPGYLDIRLGQFREQANEGGAVETDSRQVARHTETQGPGGGALPDGVSLPQGWRT